MFQINLSFVWIYYMIKGLIMFVNIQSLVSS